MVEIELRTGVVTPITGPKTMVAAGSTLSPDGEWIAFTSTRGDQAGLQAVLIVVAPSGGKPVQLTDHALDARHPVWSPDGRRLVFSALLPGSRQAYGLATIRVPALSPRAFRHAAGDACGGEDHTRIRANRRHTCDWESFRVTFRSGRHILARHQRA